MGLPEGLHVLHQPTRLRIMALVCRYRDVGFADVRDHLALTDGNLGSHARRLEDEGLLEVRRGLGRTGITVRYRPSAEGDRRMARYLAWLDRARSARPAGAPSDRRAAGPG